MRDKYFNGDYWEFFVSCDFSHIFSLSNPPLLESVYLKPGISLSVLGITAFAKNVPNPRPFPTYKYTLIFTTTHTSKQVL